MADQTTGTPPAESADDIRSALSAALARAEAPPEPVKPDAPTAEASTEQAAEGAETGEEKATAEAPAEGQESEQDPAETEESKSEEVPAAVEPPANWPEADKAMFKKAPKEMQEWALRRSKEMEADYTRKTQAVAELKREYEPVDQIFAPHREVMKAKGLTPRTIIEGWANVERQLMSGNVDIVKGIVEGYKLDRAKVAQALGLTNAAAPATENPADGTPQNVALPPEVVNELKTLREKVDARERREQEAARLAAQEAAQRIESDIQAFKSAADDKGNLLHPYYDDVESQMVALVNAARAGGQKIPTLQELYDTAVWANPSTRERLLTAQRQAEEAKRKEEARAKAAAAKKAASSVTGAPSAGQVQVDRPVNRSLREELEANAAELSA